MDTIIRSLSHHRGKLLLPVAAGFLVLALMASALLWGGTASAQLQLDAGTTVSGTLTGASAAGGTVTVDGEVADVSGAALIIVNGTVSTLAELEAHLAAQIAAGIEVSVTIIVTAEGKIIVIVGDNPGEDFITGGGWIIGPHGAKANFGLVAGPSRSPKKDFRGSVNYVDHGAGAGEVRHVKSTSITGYFGRCPSTIRHISGEAKVNGQAGFTFLAHAEDNGEPGRNDRFGIRVFNASGVIIYSAFGTLGNGGPGGGNIKLHPPCDKQ